jgi:hypothetical protein
MDKLTVCPTLGRLRPGEGGLSALGQQRDCPAHQVVGIHLLGIMRTGAKKEASSQKNADLNMYTEKAEKGKRRILIRLTDEHGNARI